MDPYHDCVQGELHVDQPLPVEVLQGDGDLLQDPPAPLQQHVLPLGSSGQGLDENKKNLVNTVVFKQACLKTQHYSRKAQKHLMIQRNAQFEQNQPNQGNQLEGIRFEFYGNACRYITR